MATNLPTQKPTPPKIVTSGTVVRTTIVPKQPPQGGGAPGTGGRR